MSEWTPPARPEWVQRVIDEGQHMDIRSLVPLRAEELMDTARRNTGFADFGSDDWLEGFHVFLQALEEEADLHLLGRLMTRSDILRWLEARLGIEAAYAQHPEIEDEVIDQPVVITGLPRSGTSILFELLAQDMRFGSPRNWEMMFPYPPPEAAHYHNDPRIARCEHLVTQWKRVVPSYATMHEMGAEIPNECIVAMSCTFRSENLPGQYQIPRYNDWYYQQDLAPAYRYYKRMLKVLQWKNPRQHWLLKAPSHLGNLSVLFQVFPDARVVITHRDPIVAQASVTNLLGTLYWMRSSKAFDARAFESLMTPEAGAARLNAVIDLLQSGLLPNGQLHSFLYHDLIQEPLPALANLFQALGMPLDAAGRNAMQAYLSRKPQGKFGRHEYSVTDAQRQLYQRYQTFFSVPDEA
ncbi:MAG: sulfotransferase family protein [Haliea sp.]|uniref:sulfotransferase family protein n=1 Tax=Haliea sp. TaxID=1932666 RepID=UPI000C3EA721|nr:sulfotransferase [Haliea sp.]MBM68928.1 sulfotransferase family protein [Haliea sp.]|tara:strand:- start:391 stop:1620 length:1230 start_codon:yes stop_codon:yes gene_type:complete